MNRFLQKLCYVIFILNLIACGSYKKSKDGVVDGIYLYQNGVEIKVNSTYQAFTLANDSFSIRYLSPESDMENRKIYSAKMAGFVDVNELDKIQEGMRISDIICFKPGSGMAPNTTGKYDLFSLTNKAHHYLFYLNDKNKRVRLLEKQNNSLLLDFEISKIYVNRRQIDLFHMRGKEFYIAVLIDKNLNGIIEKNELFKFIIAID
ncbi:MAG: hypothetical protein N4A49_15175 [Marinifilaceae bacterium]|nr:hypothetical protein [Marinifilaceae bacterium]